MYPSVSSTPVNSTSHVLLHSWTQENRELRCRVYRGHHERTVDKCNSQSCHTTYEFFVDPSRSFLVDRYDSPCRLLNKQTLHSQSLPRSASPAVRLSKERFLHNRLSTVIGISPLFPSMEDGFFPFSYYTCRAYHIFRCFLNYVYSNLTRHYMHHLLSPLTMTGLRYLLLSVLPLLTYGQSENATAAEQPFRSFNSTPYVQHLSAALLTILGSN